MDPHALLEPSAWVRRFAPLITAGGSVLDLACGRGRHARYLAGLGFRVEAVDRDAEALAGLAGVPGVETRVNGVLIDRFADGERTGYPTLCKGRFDVDDETYYAIEEPASLNTLKLLPDLMAMGVRAIKIEGRQRSVAYVAQVTRIWRDAIDAARREGERFAPREAWMADLNKVSEGQSQTLGAYYRPWK